MAPGVLPGRVPGVPLEWNELRYMQGCPGIWIGIHQTTPLRGRAKKNPPICFFLHYDSCNNRTEEAYPHIKANNATSHHIRRTTYYTCYSSVVCGLVVQLHGRVVQYLRVLVVERGFPFNDPARHSKIAGGGRFSAVPFLVLYSKGGGSSLPSPVYGSYVI